MKIVVCVKQVYDTSQLKFDDATGDMRPGAELILNPYCEYALETALRLKEAKGEGTIIAATVGTGGAKEALKKALAIGADEAFIIDDPAVESSDSAATALALAHAIRQHVPDAQLILMGQTAAESATGATGPQLAEALDWPCLTFVKQAELAGESVQIKRETEAGIETHTMALPGVLCTMKCDYEPRMANIKGVMKANRTEIPSLPLAAIGLEASQVGSAGAFSAIAKTFPRPARPAGQKLAGLSSTDAAAEIVRYLQTQKLV